MAFDKEGLLRLLDESFGKAAWHGTNLRGAVRGLDLKQASWRPNPGRHNIWEITVHTAYWKYAVRRRITGEKRGTFARPGSNWFVRPGNSESDSWQHDVTLLEEENRKLWELIRSLTPQRLSEQTGRKRWTVAEMLMGVAFHDIYHAGQIQLLKRLQD